MKNLICAILLTFSMPVMAGQNVVIVFDDSGSMGTPLRSNGRITRMEAARTALIEVVSKLPDDTNLGIVLLNGDWQNWKVPFGTLNKQNAISKIQTIGPTGGTPLGGCMKVGTDVLMQHREKQRYGIYKLLIVTDGEANDQNLVDLYTPDIVSRGLTVDVIGVDMMSTHTLATKVNNYRKADDPNSLKVAIAATFAETSGDDKSSNDDFSIIAAIPEKMAPKLLQAIQVNSNYPIGEARPTVKIDNNGAITVVQQSEKSNPISIVLCVIGGAFVLVVIFVIIAANN